MAEKFGMSLLSLGLGFCQGMTGESISILPHFTKLQRLSLRGIPALTDKAISAALEVCGSFLRDLDVEECPHLGEGTLEAISINCRQLWHIYMIMLSACLSMTILTTTISAFSDAYNLWQLA